MIKLSLLPLILVSALSLSQAQTLKGRTNTVRVDISGPVIANPEIPKSTRKNRALIMGVSKYKHEGIGLQSLDNPTKDAQLLYDMLTANYTFDPADIILLKDPTRQEIIDSFDKLSEVTTKEDNVLVFYAGHGVWDKQKELGYWLPSDAELKSKSAWIANSQIKDYLSDNVIRSKHTLLITDACFGGSIFKSRSVTTETVVRINELYKEPSRKAMTSGNLSVVPDKSIFIQQLLKKLGDNEDDFLPAQQLFSRMYEPIVNNATTNPLYGTIQGAGDGGGDFIFIRRK
ncbi:MAG: caspase family protein [Cyclobacteriaceae bacterium]|nr:caspase family protein [Cyclobacteriaceae bacterium]